MGQDLVVADGGLRDAIGVARESGPDEGDRHLVQALFRCFGANHAVAHHLDLAFVGVALGGGCELLEEVTVGADDVEHDAGDTRGLGPGADVRGQVARWDRELRRTGLSARVDEGDSGVVDVQRGPVGVGDTLFGHGGGGSVCVCVCVCGG